ncbi:MAG: hypothetical protein MJ164_04065 [Alphaproteobacteria bacterium]|nr:hypothetical protein [Alphaproteobacteria bacterium]
MPNKTIKKNTTKKTVVKKTATKPVAKKTTVRRPEMTAPVQQNHECACGHHCHCCGCGHHFVKFCIKLVVLCAVFFLGCIASPWLMKHPDHHRMKHNIAFDDNGCVVLESVKCPKMLEMLATADDDANGCISKTELKNAMHAVHQEKTAESSDDTKDTDDTEKQD